MLNVSYTKPMKRFFVFFSIILLLGSNIAMALDADCLSIDQQQQSLSDYDQNNDNDADLTDSCCHSASHFVGIYPDNFFKTSFTGNSYVVIPLSIASSQTYQPATPPPTV